MLIALLQSLPTDSSVIALLDTRVQTSEMPHHNLEVKWVKPSVWQRLKAEWWLAKMVKHNDLVLCFGNLPPLYQLQGTAVVFVQNRYLIDPISLKSFPFKTWLRLKIERCWFFWKTGNAHSFIVQSPSMQTILTSSGRIGSKPIYVFPFVKTSQGYQRTLKLAKRANGPHDFLYVASGEPHKNHRRLIEAWCLLANEGLFPSLFLTLDTKIHAHLCDWVDKKKRQFDLNLQNLGTLSHEQILHFYTQVQALIYPSTFESFGLPLIEARQAGLAVLASELDFVRDVLDPEQVFDPHSPLSIARAVKRFMGASEEGLPLLNSAEFMKKLLEKWE